MLLGFCLLTASGLIQTPSLPDFSGEWVLDPAKTTVTGAPARVGGPASGAARGSTITEPRKIKDVKPVYPVDAQRSRISGFVVLEATIDVRGKVDDLRVLRSVPAFDRAALDAVSKWEYTPTLLDGVPVPVIMTVTVTFSIDSGPLQPSVPVWPSQPAGALRPGFGRGAAAAVMVIEQDERSLTMKRKYGELSEEIRYRLDGRESRNKLPGTGGAIDSQYTFVSRWEGEKLVTSITWTGPQGPRQRAETIWIEGDLLTVQTSRAAMDPGGAPFVTSNVFWRARRAGL